jgi:hypothetical protein
LDSVPSTKPWERYLPFVFDLLIGLSAAFAVLMIVIGGFQYITTDAIQAKSAGKERIKNAVLGLVLVISAWLILNEINPELLTLKLDITPAPTASPTTGGSSGGTPSGGRAATGDDLLTGASLQADADIRDNLGNISVNNPPCTAARTSSCTNLNGLPSTLISSLQLLQTSCQYSVGSCVVMITGGTETSLHSAGTAHKPGNPVVDLSASSPNLNSYLGFPNPKSGDTVTMNGLKFTFEVAGQGGYSTGDHWHVTK